MTKDLVDIDSGSELFLVDAQAISWANVDLTLTRSSAIDFRVIFTWMLELLSPINKIESH